MSTSTNTSLPIIDYPKLHSRNAQGNRVSSSLEERSRLFSALKDTGFAYLRHPSINQDTIDHLFSHTKTFFAKSLEEKLKIKGEMEKGRGPSQGYSNPAKLAHDSKTSDLKEFFGMYSDEDKEKPNQWLTDSASVAMHRDLVAFFDSCHIVIQELLMALAEEVGLPPSTLQPYIEEKNHFIACLHYPGTKADAFEMRTRAAAHTDYGCLTLLFNDSKEGLQVMNKESKYVYVPRIDGCAVLNVGDLTSRFFNGILPSTVHRVVEPSSTNLAPDAGIPSRYSIAFFGHYNLSTLVKPLDTLVTEKRSAQFEPIEAGEHVKARVKQLHVAGHSLKDEKKKEKITGPNPTSSATA